MCGHALVLGMWFICIFCVADSIAIFDKRSFKRLNLLSETPVPTPQFVCSYLFIFVLGWACVCVYFHGRGCLSECGLVAFVCIEYLLEYLWNETEQEKKKLRSKSGSEIREFDRSVGLAASISPAVNSIIFNQRKTLKR